MRFDYGDIQVTETVRVPWSMVADMTMEREGNKVCPRWAKAYLGSHHPTFPHLKCLVIQSVKRVTLFSSDEAELVLGYGNETPQWVMSTDLTLNTYSMTLATCTYCNGSFKYEEVTSGRCPNCKRKQGEQ